MGERLEQKKGEQEHQDKPTQCPLGIIAIADRRRVGCGETLADPVQYRAGTPQPSKLRRRKQGLRGSRYLVRRFYRHLPDIRVVVVQSLAELFVIAVPERLSHGGLRLIPSPSPAIGEYPFRRSNGQRNGGSGLFPPRPHMDNRPGRQAVQQRLMVAARGDLGNRQAPALQPDNFGRTAGLATVLPVPERDQHMTMQGNMQTDAPVEGIASRPLERCRRTIVRDFASGSRKRSTDPGA